MTYDKLVVLLRLPDEEHVRGMSGSGDLKLLCLPIRTGYDASVTAIRVVFDGNVFIPQQPISLPAQSEWLVIVEQADPNAQAQLNAAVRAYYQAGPDAEDEAWTRATAPRSQRAWNED